MSDRAAQIFLDGRVSLYIGDCFAVLETMQADSVDCVVTSPPYWGLRDYGVDRQIGLERTLDEHLAVMVGVFQAVRRVLKPTGTLWINYGDCYASTPNGRSAADTKAVGNDDRTFRDKPFSTIGGFLKPKDLCLIPSRLAIALQEAGWWVRSEIVWGKTSPMPDSAGKYRPSTAHEKIFLLTKTGKGFYDADAVKQPVSGNAHSRVSKVKVPGAGGHGTINRGSRTSAVYRDRKPGVTPKSAGEDTNIRAKGSFHSSTTEMVESRYLRNYEPAPLQVWRFASQAFPEAHFATFPPELAERCILAGCPKGGLVLDPFGGAGTTALVALRHQRRAALIELNPAYADMARTRIETEWRVATRPSRTVDIGPLFTNKAAE